MAKQAFMLIRCLFLVSGILAEAEFCKTKFEETDTSSGCKECIDGAYYQMDVTPPPSKVHDSLGQEKKKYECFKCPDNSVKCKFETETKKVTIDTCMDKFYVEKVDGSNDKCNSCPTFALSCKKENNKISITECEIKYYKFTNETGDECISCPKNSKKCRLNEETKKIVIEKQDCDQGYYVENGEKGNTCESCLNTPVGCYECTSATECTKCQTSYFLESSKCEKCSIALEGCENCSLRTKCDKCIDAKVEPKDGACVNKSSGKFMLWLIVVVIGILAIGAAFLVLKHKKSKSEHKASLMMSGEYEEV